jgi:hypothetical protein
VRSQIEFTEKKLRYHPTSYHSLFSYKRTIRNKFEGLIGELSKEQVFAAKKPKIKDHGGSRSGTDRRKYKLMTWNLPERRLGSDRRKRIDRRGQVARKGS